MDANVEENVPPRVDFAEEKVAADLVPVLLRVRGRRDGLVLRGTCGRPAGLSDPDRLAIGGSNGRLIRRLEERLALGDAVGHSVLEVRVRIDADEVARGDNGIVGGIHPGGPGIDVTDRGSDAGGVERSANLGDVVGDIRRLGTDAGHVFDTSGRDAVEVFTANADADD